MKPLDPRLLRYARAARPFIVGCAGLGVLTAGLLLVQAELLAHTITAAFLAGAGLATLAVPVGLLAAVVLGRAAVAWLSETAAHRACADVLAQLRGAIVARALSNGSGASPERSPADLATLASTGVDRLQGYFARYLPQLLIAAVVPAVVAARILAADWVAALIVALTVPLIPLFMILIGLYTQRDTTRQWRTLAVLGNHFLDLVAGLAVLSAFGRAKAQLRTLRQTTEAYRRHTMRTLRVAFLSALALELLATLSVAVIAVSIGLRLLSGDMDLHTALVVLILAPEVYLPIRAVGARFHDSAEGVAAAEDIFELLEQDRVAAGRSPAPDPSRVAIRLREVTVHGRSGPILDRLNLRLEPGAVLGITGRSGAGKSTVLDLLLGWRRPARGQVMVDGVDLSDVDRAAWQRRIAWVPQRPRLLAGTVADNIRLGRPDATDADVAGAAEAAGLAVALDRQVGELGAGLSTGEQRRVALARALLLDRPLLLLDEPTEGVDAETEEAILSRLPGLLAGRTAVIVTHRASVLRVCDQRLRLASAPQPALTPTEQAEDARRSPGQASVPAPAPADDPAETESTVTGSVWRWLHDAVRPYRARLALASLAGVAALGSGVALTATSAWLIASAALHPPVLALMVAIVAVRALGLSKGVFRYAERLVSHDVALRAVADMRERVWRTLVRLGPAITAKQRKGVLLNRLMSDVDSQQDVLVRVVVPVTASTAVAVGAAGSLGLLLPQAGIVALLGLLVAGLLAPALTAVVSRRSERDTAALRAAATTQTVETLQAAPDLIAFDAAAAKQVELDATNRAWNTALRRSAAARGFCSGLGVLALGLTMLGCLTIGILALRAGAITGPVLAVLALTPLAMTELVAALPEAAQRLLAARHAAARLAELDRTPTAAAEPDRPRTADPGWQLGARRMSVRWPSAATAAVRDLDLELGAGQAIVLTGPSGSGKSTALTTLMRYLDPTAGHATMNNHDSRQYRSEDVRDQIGWCGPDTHLFDSTLRENLLLAKPGASDQQLRDCLTAARLGDWLQTLPEGLDTALGAHGSPVSGGERQRIAVARALLADRPFLLLDEPTAHLDRPTAEELITDLRALATNRPTLIATHQSDSFPEFREVRLANHGTPARPAITTG